MNDSTERSGLGNLTQVRGNLRGSLTSFAQWPQWHENTNCYSGHGGDNIDDDSDVGHGGGSEYSCNRYCEQTPDCQCATFEPATGKCWRLRWCNIGQCLYDPKYKVITSGQTPSPPPPSNRWYDHTNCYSVHG